MLDLLGKLLTQGYFERPVFVVGASRSGTSVLLQALGRHPKILAAPGEAPFLTSIGGAVGLFEFAENSEYYNQSLICTKDHLYGQLKRLALETAAGAHFGLKTLVKVSHSRRRLMRPAYWCAKTFPTRRGADALVALYPEARFVYIVRNGLEVVQSRTKFSGFSDKGFVQQCRGWAQSVDTFDYLREYQYAVSVRHEELRQSPQELFERVFDFLRLPLDQAVVDFVRNTVVHPLDEKTREHADARDEFARRPPPYAIWSEQQKAEFVENCRPSMQRLGYEIPFDG